MTANPALVYQSTVPDRHRPIVEANQANRTMAVEAMEALAASLIPGANAWAFRSVTSAISMTGISLDRSPVAGDAKIPAGLRRDSKVRGFVLVPAKRTEEGKALAEQMRALAFKPASLGAPARILAVTDGVHDYWGSADFEVITHDDTVDVYATYRQPLRDGDRDKGIVDADPDWVEIPLSQFYAAREHAKAQTGADPDAAVSVR
jgi:hypothetical protein